MPDKKSAVDSGSGDMALFIRPKNVPMEILVLGLCRTGTQSLKKGMLQLGIRQYHMEDNWRNGDAQTWVRALEYKYEGKGEPITKAEWDSVYADYHATSDIPSSIFVDELIAAYPNAKILLSTRSIDSWYTSVLNTVYDSMRPSLYRSWRIWVQQPDPSQVKMMEMIFENFFYNDFPRFGKRVFIDHNAHVRRAAAEAGMPLLEWTPSDGWEPLCEFLGKDVPDTPFPRVNDTESFRKMFKLNTKDVVSRVLNGVGLLTPVVVGLLAWKKWSGKWPGGF